ncbi:MAG: hypothetical protein AAGB51_13735 [Planctomycetota bacterium]
MRRMIAGSFLMLAASYLSGCISNRIYNDEPHDYLRSVEVADGPSVQTDIAIIEFDDFGTFWNKRQLLDAIDLIKTRITESEGRVVVPVFVHGWQNNADPDRKNGDLFRFRESMARLSAQFGRAAKAGVDSPEAIVGVYLSWRGATTRVPLANQLTFWSRRRAAERVASFDMREAMFRLTEAVKAEPESMIVITGHSMGGMIVAKTLAPSLTTLALAAENGDVPTVIDMVVLQNPALEALDALQLVEFLKEIEARIELRRGEEVIGGGGPALAAITSEADWVTKVAYPTGRVLNNLARATRKDRPEGQPSQWHMLTRAVGHVDYLVSHEAYIDDNGELQVEPIEGAWNNTPFWIIRCSPEISRNHGDVHNERFANVIGRLVEINQTFDPTVKTWLVTDQEGEKDE